MINLWLREAIMTMYVSLYAIIIIWLVNLLTTSYSIRTANGLLSTCSPFHSTEML